MIKLAIFELNFTFDNDNYVNKLSIWTAYYIFCLAWGFSKMLAVPHRQQAKKSNYLQNEKINKIFILGCYKILKLMDMAPPICSRIFVTSNNNIPYIIKNR
ncbi:hypothetical protein CN544_19165 [Bacillus toyonensis]|uniref:Transposase n=1 Tax=Bacillus toyonensis TaxID=155322 RepID=A0AB73SI95_9BACI|nr:hypothetical protein COO04_27140 [Bacillus toyonensis]PEI86117.1 hypothetical protein CN678_13300 [Bacillus toyonensis]PEK05625.1 hypothetical protein CN681_30420 [Bacillus toyonensis]PEK12162.1 hypothetical protein CN683_23610 [Bacillus toyonensis]PEL47818.1 hypothetical protein CN638_25685 [Bacillus toyonensis]